MAAMGTSAGGHLSVLLGTSGDEKELEGDVGGNLDQSSRVQAIVDFFGPVDFVMRTKDQPDQTDKETGRTYLLLGGAVLKNIELAKQASGAFHVTKDDPPLIIFHGTKDNTVHMNQAERIRDAYKEQGLEVEFHTVEGAGHGGPLYSTPECHDLVVKFLDGVLKK
jgi:acetyl esterase/lipase